MGGKPELNKPAFDRATEALQAMGFFVFNPASFPADEAEPSYVARDLKALSEMDPKQDLIALLPGWLDSSGATAEAAVAVWRGIDIVHVPEWVVEPNQQASADAAPEPPRHRSDEGGVPSGLLPFPGPKRVRTDVDQPTISGSSDPCIRTFDSGATRDRNDTKFDYRGFLAPEVLEQYAAYMHRHRVQPDGSLRASDNWKKGIPKEEHLASMLRHNLDLWDMHTSGKAWRVRPDGEEVRLLDTLSAILFAAQGYMYEVLHGR